MPANDIYQAVIGANLKGQKLVNVIHFEQTSVDGAIAPANDLCLAIVEDLLPTYRLAVSQDMTFEVIKAHRVKPTVAGTYVHAISLAGLVAEDTLPPNGAAMATLYSATMSRAGRGRIYMSGVPDTFVQLGRLVTTGADLYVDFLDKLVLPIQASVGATFQAGCFTRPLGDFHDYTSHELRARINTVRSRRMENP